MKSVSIILLLLVALTMSLVSCVNEVKNQTGGVPIDSNYLHQFLKIKVVFTGLEIYSQRKDTESYSIIFNDQDPTIISVSLPPLKWNGNSFVIKIDSGYSYSHVDSNGGFHSYLQQYNFQQNIFGEISKDGASLDTLVDFFTDYVYLNAMHAFDKHFLTSVIRCHSLPQVKNSPDSLVFSFVGSSLNQKIDILSNKIASYDPSQMATLDSLQTILWNEKPPSLSVTFYR